MTFSSFRWCWCAALCLVTNIALAQTFVGQVVQPLNAKWLSDELQTVQIFAIDSRALLKTVQNNPAETTIRLRLGDSHDWQLTLHADPIQSDDYQLIIAYENQISNNQIATYRGEIANGGTCYLTLSAGFIYGVFEIQNKTYFIEPARRFNATFGEDQYLFYEAAAILPNPNGRCAGALFAEKSNILSGLEKTERKCYTVEVAIAADYAMYQLFNDVALLEKYVLAILNSVRANYDDEFDYEMRFQVTNLWVATCPTCDPWSTTNDYEALLASFRNWGNADNFNKSYDIATLWTGRVLTDRNGSNIGGGGYYGVLCGRSRYNVLRRYSENAGLMRALQAHELGHNLNADHDSTNAQTIMAPFIRNVTEWSSTSRIRMNNYFATALGLSNCLTECAVPTVPTADFFVLNNSGCAPFTVQFYNHSSPNATAWQWTFGNTAISTETNPVATFIAPGLYDVKLRASNAAGGKEIVKTALIEVKGPPKAAIDMTYVPGETTAILKSTIAADSLRWYLHGGETSEERILTIDFKTEGNYPITLIVYNECGADTVQQTLNIVTAPKAGFVANNVIGCVPLQVRFENQSSDNATFAWEFPGGTPATSTERHPNVRYEQPGVYSVVLVVRNAAGTVTARQSNLVQVNRSPKTSFSFRIEKNVVSFRNLTENGSTYIWHFGDGTSGNWTNPVHTYTAAGLYNVRLIASNACGSDTFQRAVEIVGAAPVAAFTANIKTGCAPLTVTFNDVSTQEPTQRQWQFPGGEPATSQQASPVVRYTQAGTYPVWLEVVNEFGRDTLNEQNFVTVTNKPQAAFGWTIERRKVTFNVLATTQENQSYQWQFGDGNSLTVRTPTHEYDMAGVYKVALIVSNTCGSDTLQQTITLITTATTTLPSPFTTFLLFPNPNEGSFQLSLRGVPQARLLLRVVNGLGQILQQQSIDFSSGNVLQPIDLKQAVNGMYWLEIRGETGRVTKSFTVQKR